MKQTAVPRPSKRGRPSLARAQSLDGQILATAGSMFLRDGFDVVTMEAIANAIPLSKTTLYSRFPSKEGLLEAVVTDQIRQWSENAFNELPPLPDDIGIRLRIKMRTMALAMRLPAVQGFIRLTFVLSERFPAVALLMHEGHVNHVADIQADIEAAAQRDNAPVRNAAAVARHLVNSVAGWNIQEFPRGPTEEEALEAADQVVALFMAARWAW